MEDAEIMLDDKVIKVAIKIPKEEIDENNMRLLLDDTIELNDLVEEIKNDE